jgi:hypothetical protein
MFIALSSYIEKRGKAPVNNLMINLKLIEKQEQAKPQISGWKEVIKIWAEIYDMDTKR